MVRVVGRKVRRPRLRRFSAPPSEARAAGGQAAGRNESGSPALKRLWGRCFRTSMRTFVLLILVAVLSGCASGSAPSMVAAPQSGPGRAVSPVEVKPPPQQAPLGPAVISAPVPPPPPIQFPSPVVAKHPIPKDPVPPSMLLAPSQTGRPDQPLPSVTLSLPHAAPGESAPVTGWQESPGSREIPDLNVVNRTSGRTVLFVWAASTRYRWDVSRGLATSIMPGEYDYALCGPFYEATGKPDARGKLRCRRWKRYNVTILDGVGSDTAWNDLGDPY